MTVKKLMKAKKKDPVEIGKALSELKGTVSHGQWGEVLKREAGISHRTADRYLNVYRRFPNGIEYDVPFSVLANLAKPSTPDHVVDKALKIYAEGGRLSPEQVDEMAEQAGALQVKTTPAQRILKAIADAEKGIRTAPTLSCIEREDITAGAARLLDWLRAPEARR